EFLVVGGDSGCWCCGGDEVVSGGVGFGCG
ncbi:hypothetical protein A2U01_0096049, partial [Trifolium medium]|nr:hypothetical protein [Trifolium medium]